MKVLCMHTAGLGELVAMSLAADVNAQVAYADDSAVVINTTVAESKLGSLSYVKNCFVIIGSVPRRRDLAQAVDTVSRQLSGWPLQRTRKPYRLMFSEDGKLTGIPGNTRSRLESVLGKATGGRIQPRGGGDEYWTISRRDLDEVLFCRRLPRPKRTEPPKGGLAPDVAELIVNAIGRGRPNDVVLDPFAGSGALIGARIGKPFREAICSDLGYSDRSTTPLPEIVRRKGVRILTDDARTLASIPDASVDVVVTDPPWGEFDQQDEPATLLIDQALASIRRVLRGNGRLAMLVSRRLTGEVMPLWAGHGLSITRTYDLLINGHPSTLLVGSSGT